MCQLLARDYADVNACDNRGVSCVMAAFRKGNVKVVKWLVKHVSQFPADADCKRFMATVSDKVKLKRDKNEYKGKCFSKFEIKLFW